MSSFGQTPCSGSVIVQVDAALCETMWMTSGAPPPGKNVVDQQEATLHEHVHHPRCVHRRVVVVVECVDHAVARKLMSTQMDLNHGSKHIKQTHISKKAHIPSSWDPAV